LTSQETAVKCL